VRTEHVWLRHPPQAMSATVSLREPCGSDEIAVDGVDTRCAVTLLGRLLDSVGPMASELVAPDRDALLAALHRRCWGDRIVTTLTCSQCEQLFDLSFELSAVQRHLASLESAWQPDGRGQIVHESGAALQVPRLAQELEAASRDPRTGASRLAEICGAFSPEALGALENHGEDARGMAMEAASDALQAAAPLIDLELAASCANCGHEQSAHFDLQSFLLQRLINERENLLAEVHLLASTYGWSLSEILSMARSTRRQLANAIDDLNSRAAARRGAWR
jgi:hypothetical protein